MQKKPRPIPSAASRPPLTFDGQAPDEGHENHQVGQALGVLPGVHGAYAKGKDAGQNAGQGRVRTGNRDARNRSRTRRKRRGGRRQRAFQPRCQTILAIDYAAHVARAVGAQRLTAGSAKGRSRNIGMVGAVHENLLYVFTITTGGSCGAAASTGWLSPRL